VISVDYILLMLLRCGVIMVVFGLCLGRLLCVRMMCLMFVMGLLGLMVDVFSLRLMVSRCLVNCGVWVSILFFVEMISELLLKIRLFWFFMRLRYVRVYLVFVVWWVVRVRWVLFLLCL